MDESQEVDEQHRIAAHAQRLLASGALGKSRQTIRLFEFLLERSLVAAATKEIEIAQVVFGRSTDSDLSADATVRVHIHRLRKKLEAVPADEYGERLILPRGEYRLVIVGPAKQDQYPAPERRRLLDWRYVAAAVLFLALNATCWFWLAGRPASDSRAESILWSGVSNRPTPLLVVSGDFYVFGEQGTDGSIARVIADPAIASSMDLSQYKQRMPEAGQRYIDVNAYHLPSGLASALVSLAPIVAATRPGHSGQIKDVTTSRFTNGMLSGNDIVYVGLLDTLGDLQEPFLDLSGFSLSASGDTLVDRVSAKQFQSDWGEPSTERIMRHDYAYLARFPGPAGNQIVVVAGIMDPGLIEAAKLASDSSELSRLKARLGNSEAFEALYEVRTFGPSNVSAELVTARQLDVSQMWRARAAPLKNEAVPSLQKPETGAQ
ncbi:helix-turn-helix domain-containing protein [Pseudomonas sp. KNUC1026]|uniref:helix-turn-helix domain-containing protein n=1 Tax=Pseudomonas sp. KNUC1026 TaxID=2893890 RepID=UPI001F1BB69D|nr:helix-turn-helix domain-containing protein [Pseudomonas sp. KNUC1026]UFH48543.1 helix-turn-helix domain-containing protein [Pseudomonas sp. KNUC1026]